MEPKTYLLGVPPLLKRRRLINGVEVPVTLEEISDQFHVPVKFFEDNGLMTRTVIGEEEMIPADLELRAEDFTPEGIELFKTGYQKWLRAFSRKTPENAKKFLAKRDVSILEKSLAAIREKLD